MTLFFQPEADQDGKLNSSQSTVQPIEDLSEALIGKWCVVEYDQDVYPGIVQDVHAESGALVKTALAPTVFLGQ